MTKRKNFEKKFSERQPRSRWGSPWGLGVHRKFSAKNGQNNGLLCRYRQAHTNGKRSDENGKKRTKKAILFVSLKRCKRSETKQRTKRNETKCKENCNYLIIKHINRLNVHIKHTNTHIFNKIQCYVSECKQNRH